VLATLLPDASAISYAEKRPGLEIIGKLAAILEELSWFGGTKEPQCACLAALSALVGLSILSLRSQMAKYLPAKIHQTELITRKP
jgi:hypothetical protein